MTKTVRDIERSRYERWKALIRNVLYVGLILLVGAAIRFHINGWKAEALPIGYAVAGLCLLSVWPLLKRRWRNTLGWRPDR